MFQESPSEEAEVKEQLFTEAMNNHAQLDLGTKRLPMSCFSRFSCSLEDLARSAT